MAPRPDLSRVSFRLDGRVAVVTGAGRGLGRALAFGLADAGAAVVLADRDGPSVRAVADELAPAAKAAALCVDITDERACRELFDRARADFGWVDVLVNNAAIDIIEPVEAVTLEHWRQVLDVNLTGAFLCARIASEALGEGGSIINITSIAASAAVAGLASYSAAKAGLTQLTRVMALELAPRGIRVNAVAPGYLENVMAGAGTVHGDPATETRIRTFTPLGRRARLSEIVGPVVFLASPAASYITGSILAVDGGYTAV
jgi:NAD(P)-dependent dehydrogenase (short-subunit alcohol dehydrogenase family)